MNAPVSLRWTILVDGAVPAAVNMARDAALTHHVSAAVSAAPSNVGEGAPGSPGAIPNAPAMPAFLRFYSWARPTLSLGRNEPARRRFDPEWLAAEGVDVVRRPTGGRAVLHDREVTYAVVVPDRALGGPRESYRRIHAALADGLSRLGADVELATDRPAVPLDAGPCFDRPAGGEVMALGRKLVGSAQARLGKALLQHGSVLLHDDQERIGHLARPNPPRRGGSSSGRMPPTGSGSSRPVTLAELVDPIPSTATVIARVVNAMIASLPGRWPDAVMASDACGDGVFGGLDDTIARFASPDWTWRR